MRPREISKQHVYSSRVLTTTYGNDAIYCSGYISENSSSGEFSVMEYFWNVVETYDSTEDSDHSDIKRLRRAIETS